MNNDNDGGGCGGGVSGGDDDDDVDVVSKLMPLSPSLSSPS